MKTADFHFDLPERLIAQRPLARRAQSRLMHLDCATGEIGHHHFHDLPQLLSRGDLMVFNNTRVIPARLFGRKVSGGKVELLIERVLDGHRALVQIRASKSPGAGTEITLEGDVTVKVLGREGDFFVVEFPAPGPAAIAAQVGHMPLPPYIERPDDMEDQERYQTVYASRRGAVAAPTAGLHFDEELLAALDAKGLHRTELTLHVAAGTFQPMRADDIADHQMHAEHLEVPQEVCDAVAACRARQGKVVAVGTTSVRGLEAASSGGALAPHCGDTDIFIRPGHAFRAVDAMITNFHLPGSTLIVLVSAFAGLDAIKRAYAEAIRHEYRFFSYGDAMLITGSSHVADI